jgi:tetratricopeptide (TPR) repeat protein
MAKGDKEGAIADYQKAFSLDTTGFAPDFKVTCQFNLARLLLETQRPEEAAEAFKKAMTLPTYYIKTHSLWGEALEKCGKFTEAAAVLKEGHERGLRTWPYPPAEAVRGAELLAELDTKLPAVLKGEIQPSSPEQRINYGQVCKFKRLYHAATRFYEEAFAAKPELMEQTAPSHRYNAACYAALAVCGQGKDAERLPDKVIATLRRQALRWLRADLAHYAQLAQRNDPRAKGFVQQQLALWQQDADLASLRDPGALDRLPDDERAAWRRLWADVAALRQKVEEKK